jgi:GNAT superfamily N-acetyltransferase
MNVELSLPCDLSDWLALAREVEPLFGPMADVPEFQDGLRQAMQEKRALNVRLDDSQSAGQLAGGIIIDALENEILWLAVSGVSRGKGIGRLLLREAIGRLDPNRPVYVQTYDDTVEVGAAAREHDLTLRIGAHVGEVELAGDDVRGVTVHEAARVMAAAAPGEIIVSEAVRLLCQGSDLAFEDAGEHELKGVPGRSRLFKVVS